ARDLLERAEELVRVARGGPELLAGPLRLGVIPTVAPFLLPRVLPRLLEARPNLDLQLREDLTARLVEQLHAGLLDVLLIALPYEAANLHAEPILEDPFLLASPAGETGTGPVRLDELRGRRILLLQDGH